MKKVKILTAVAVLCVAVLASCVNDLNTEPIDPNIKQTFDANMVFNKIYASLGISGQTGPDGDCDIVANDEGYSVWYRLICVHNEFPADGGWWIWNSDAGCSNLLETSWDEANPFVKLLYNRLTFNATLCNHFFDNTGGNPEGLDEAIADASMRTMRAEVRCIRAMHYFYMMDFFGNPPFVTTVSNEYPRQMEGGRPALFKWIESELKACESTLSETGSYYRVHKDVATLLLARLYLNAEVYTGTPMYKEAADRAKLLADKYPLAPKYANLFMGDNDRNGAEQEVLFAIAQDGVQVESWGGSSYWVASTRSSSMLPYGSNDGWTCWRSSPELIQLFVKASTAKSTKANEKEMPALLGDDRALFCSQVLDSAGNVQYETSFAGPAAYGTGNFEKCWSVCKWTGVYSTGEQKGSHDKFVDTDIPLFRAAEAYLTYAEAAYRLGLPDAEKYMQKVRDRAHCTKTIAEIGGICERTLMDEWQREFYTEGRRRMDLIRFGAFTGKGTGAAVSSKTDVHYHWEGRGRNASGASVSSTVDEKFNLYPIPSSDRVANPYLTYEGCFKD